MARRHAALGLALALTLAGCAAAPPRRAPPPLAPEVSATGASVPEASAALPGESARSTTVRRHFSALEAQHLGNGLLRSDGGAELPLTPRMIEDAFVRIALYDEYAVQGGRFIARERPARLRRWDGPVRIGITFGPSVPAAQRQRDRAAVAALARQLSQATRHPVGLDEARANLHLHILSEDEREAAPAEWARRLGGVDPAVLQPAADMGLETVCLALAFTPRTSPVYAQALVVVRAELPDLLRLSCFHEEIAQALGLANDWPRARPSIFNDDEEFATLTQLDLLLLRILYDPRLAPGLREAEARPIVAQIAAELLAGSLAEAQPQRAAAPAGARP